MFKRHNKQYGAYEPCQCRFFFFRAICRRAIAAMARGIRHADASPCYDANDCHLRAFRRAALRYFAMPVVTLTPADKMITLFSLSAELLPLLMLAMPPCHTPCARYYALALIFAATARCCYTRYCLILACAPPTPLSYRENTLTRLPPPPHAASADTLPLAWHYCCYAAAIYAATPC